MELETADVSTFCTCVRWKVAPHHFSVPSQPFMIKRSRRQYTKHTCFIFEFSASAKSARAPYLRINLQPIEWHIKLPPHKQAKTKNEMDDASSTTVVSRAPRRSAHPLITSDRGGMMDEVSPTNTETPPPTPSAIDSRPNSAYPIRPPMLTEAALARHCRRLQARVRGPRGRIAQSSVHTTQITARSRTTMTPTVIPTAPRPINILAISFTNPNSPSQLVPDYGLWNGESSFSDRQPCCARYHPHLGTGILL